MNVRVTRLANGPIIGPHLHPSIGVNIQGPSLIRVPDWIEQRLGAYYLYFADHKGSYIRLAYADHLAGPWCVHPPGSLRLAQSGFLTAPPAVPTAELARFEAQYRARGMTISHDVLSEITTPHIASPDVHVDGERRRIVMYFHGLDSVGHQVSRVAVSQNGIDFTARPDVIGRSYNLPSVRSTAYGGVNQLRDPAIYEETGVTYLLYAVGGESGIAIARVDFPPTVG